MASLWDCIDDTQKNPSQWQYLGTKEEKIRRAISEHPQAIILYAIDDEKVVVYEVYDSRQNWR